MSSTLSWDENTEIPYQPKKFNPSRLYNIIFPILIIGSIIFTIIIIFMIPVETAVMRESKAITPTILGQVQKALGTVSMFGLRNATKPGLLSRP